MKLIKSLVNKNCLHQTSLIDMVKYELFIAEK